jgi:hypothetical protein
MSIGTILLVILVIILLGGFSGFGGGPFYGTGYYGGGGLGLVIEIGEFSKVYSENVICVLLLQAGLLTNSQPPTPDLGTLSVMPQNVR